MAWECIIPGKTIEDVRADKPIILMVEKDKNAQILADLITGKGETT